MMGVSKRPASPDGKVIIPLQAHGVTMMSIGLMVDPNKAVVWRGPMLMGALQQMLNQVQWGELDVLIIDLPPGTGDVQLTLCQKTELTGAIVVSTPQDVALLDARKALDMFATLHTPILGMIENMSHIFAPIAAMKPIYSGMGAWSWKRRSWVCRSWALCLWIWACVWPATAAPQLPREMGRWLRHMRSWRAG